MQIIASILMLVMALSVQLNANPVEVYYDPPPAYPDFEVDVISISVPNSLSDFEPDSPPSPIDNKNSTTTEITEANLEDRLQIMNLRQLIEYGAEHPEQCEKIGGILTSKFKIDKRRISIKSPKDTYGPPGISLINDQQYCLTDMELAMKLMRHFGALITKLQYNWDNDRIPLLELINHFCKNLVEVNLPTEWSRWLLEPFNSVKIVIISGQLDEHLDLNRIYPSMETLKMYGVKTSDPSIIARLYPNMKNLFSYMLYQEDSLVEEVYKKNPQVESFDINCENSIEILQSVSNSAQSSNLKKLCFHPPSEFFQKRFSPMRFDSVKSFTVTSEDFTFLPDLPFIFEKLEKFKFKDEYPLNNDVVRLPSDWYKAIPNNQDLKIISMPRTELSIRRLNEYSEHFPNLRCMSFEMSEELLDNGLIQFLENTKIKMIKIKGVPVENTSDLLTKKLPSKWSYKISPEKFTDRTQTILLEQNSI